MLSQYHLTLSPDHPCRPRVEWAYRLYAALLAQAPNDFGLTAHQAQMTPVSQYLTIRGGEIRWTVSLLGENCEEMLFEVLTGLKSLYLRREGITLTITGRRCSSVADTEMLLREAARQKGVHHLKFLTATAFKSQNRYQILPSTHLLMQNLVNKWNSCILECPIEDEDGQGIEAMAAGMQIRAFHLQSEVYPLKRNAIPGFVGELVLENRLTGFQRQLADALLLFADYAGVGIKTTLGMGGVEHLSGN